MHNVSLRNGESSDRLFVEEKCVILRRRDFFVWIGVDSRNFPTLVMEIYTYFTANVAPMLYFMFSEALLLANDCGPAEKDSKIASR